MSLNMCVSSRPVGGMGFVEASACEPIRGYFLSACGPLSHLDMASRFDRFNDDDDFEDEPPQPRRGTPSSQQVFYFSQKMFDYMCERGTAEHIHQEVIRMQSDRKGVLLKRHESNVRTARLRDFVKEKGYDKPRGSELAQLRRKQCATKKNKHAHASSVAHLHSTHA